MYRRYTLVVGCWLLVVRLHMTIITGLNDLEIYNSSILLTKDVLRLCKRVELRQEFSLQDQIKRASISICANIAEGFGRKTKADLSHFLSISLGSNNETLALLDVISINFPTLSKNCFDIKEKYNI